MGKIKNFIQRGKRGFSDEDLWNLDNYLAELIYESIKAFKESDRMGYPGNFSQAEEWEEVLDEIVIGMEAGMRISYTDYFEMKKEGGNRYKHTFNEERMNRDWKLYRRGWDLLLKYIGNLWD